MKARRNIPLKLTSIVFLQLAQDYKQSGKYIKAANLLFAVIQAIEPEIPEEYMEGFTYDELVFKAFDFLNAMVRERIEPAVLAQLHKRTLEVFEGRKEHAYYEDQFEELLKVIEERVSS